MNVKERYATFRQFLGDVKKESTKVSWPGQEEVVGTTTVVIVYTALVGLFLFLVDMAITPLVNELFKAFGA